MWCLMRVITCLLLLIEFWIISTTTIEAMVLYVASQFAQSLNIKDDIQTNHYKKL